MRVRAMVATIPRHGAKERGFGRGSAVPRIRESRHGPCGRPAARPLPIWSRPGGHGACHVRQAPSDGPGAGRRRAASRQRGSSRWVVGHGGLGVGPPVPPVRDVPRPPGRVAARLAGRTRTCRRTLFTLAGCDETTRVRDPLDQPRRGRRPGPAARVRPRPPRRPRGARAQDPCALARPAAGRLRFPCR